MIVTEYKDFKRLVKPGDTVIVHYAHKYEFGYWSSYSQTRYHVLSVGDKKSKLVNADNAHHLLRLDKFFMQGQFKVEIKD